MDNFDAIINVKEDNKSTAMLLHISDPFEIQKEFKRYTSRYIKNFLEDNDITREVAAQMMKVAKNTLSNIDDPDKGISWNTLISVFSFLLNSDCPKPESEFITWYEVNPQGFTSKSETCTIPYIEKHKDCSSCWYFHLFKKQMKGLNKIKVILESILKH